MLPGQGRSAARRMPRPMPAPSSSAAPRAPMTVRPHRTYSTRSIGSGTMSPAAAAISGSAWEGSCWPGAFGARVAHHPQGVNEIGYYPLSPTDAGRALFPADLHVYHWHQEGFELPDQAELLATGDALSEPGLPPGPPGLRPAVPSGSAAGRCALMVRGRGRSPVATGRAVARTAGSRLCPPRPAAGGVARWVSASLA